MPRKAPPGASPIINLNLRATADLLKQIDEARAAMLREDSMGRIPSRSEFVRMAVDAYLVAQAAMRDGKPAAGRGRGR